MMTVLARLFVGYAVSVFGGHLLVRWLVDRYSKQVIETYPTESYYRALPAIRKFHGCMERAIYTSAVVLGVPEGIGVWLAFKALMRWRVGGENENPNIIPSSSLIFLIGTGLNLAFGVIGGLIAIGKTSLR